MDSSLDTVVHLEVQLRKLVLLVRTGLLDISKGGSVNNVTHNKSFNSFILWDGLSSRDASMEWRGV
jgi:hypothetical protein